MSMWEAEIADEAEREERAQRLANRPSPRRNPRMSDYFVIVAAVLTARALWAGVEWLAGRYRNRTRRGYSALWPWWKRYDW